MTRAAVSSVIAAGLAVASCGGDGSGRAEPGLRTIDAVIATTQSTGVPAGDAVRPFVRDCASRVASGRLQPGPDDVRVGPITIHSLRGAARRPPQEFDRKPGFGLPVKTVAEVAADARATLSVVPTDRDHVSLMYGGPGSVGRNGFRLSDGISAVAFEACPPDEPRFSSSGVVGARTQFNGGFAVGGADCYEIEVRVREGDQTLRRRVAFGSDEASCEG